MQEGQLQGSIDQVFGGGREGGEEQVAADMMEAGQLQWCMEQCGGKGW